MHLKSFSMRMGRVATGILGAIGLSIIPVTNAFAAGPSVPWSVFNLNYDRTMWLKLGTNEWGWKHIQYAHGLVNSTILKWTTRISNQCWSRIGFGNYPFYFGTTYHLDSNPNEQVAVFEVVKYVNGYWSITTAYPMYMGQGVTDGIHSYTNVNLPWKRVAGGQRKYVFPNWLNYPSKIHRDGLAKKAPVPTTSPSVSASPSTTQ